MKNNDVVIAGRPIGEGHPPYIIAEVSGNHNGDLHRAKKIMKLAREQGADAVKLQTYTADTMTIDCDLEDFRVKGGLWDGHTLYSLYQWAQTPFEWQAELFHYGREIGITVFSTPFDETAVDLLEGLDAPAYKIASFEAVDLPLIRRVARTGKPMIISTGMATREEIGEAVEAARESGCEQLILLHCVSGYPTPVDQSDLLSIPDLANRFGVVTGLSDHTLDIVTSIASVALGAKVIEKHVTYRRADGGPDAAFSLEPEELGRLCRDTKAAWSALGSVAEGRKPVEEANAAFRRSIYVVRDVAPGEVLTRDNIRIIRPGFGLAPKHFEAVLGRRARTAITRGTALTQDLVD